MIDLIETSKTFEVSNYVLPRFSINLKTPQKIYSGAHRVKFNLCGKYFYGESVKGIGMVRITMNENRQTINKAKQLRNGCSRIEFSNEELNLKQYINTDINVIATITEKGSDRSETITSSITITNHPFKLKFIDTHRHFQPGLPYYGLIRAVENFVPLSGETIVVCYNVAVEKIWNIVDIKQCSNFTFGRDNTISFNILPVKDNIIQIRLYAKSLNHTLQLEWKREQKYPDALRKEINAYLTLNRWHSHSGSYIRIDQTHRGIAKCKELQQFTIHYAIPKLRNHERIDFHYMIKARNNIHRIGTINGVIHKHRLFNFTELANVVGSTHRYTKREASSSKFLLKFKMDINIIARYEVIIYHVLKNGEVVAANLEVPIHNCLMNKVETSFSSRQYYPGEKASFTIKTSPQSLCAVTAIDKAVAVAQNTQLGIKALLESFLVEHAPKHSNKLNCLPRSQKKSAVIAAEESPRKRSKRDYGMSSSNQFDTFEAFDSFGVVVITNMKIIMKPCLQDGPLMIHEPAESSNLPDSRAAEFLSNSMPESYYNINADSYGSHLRSFFPETWLWELVPIGQHHTKISRDLPHTITNWVTNTLCISQKLGVGISRPTEITVFLPFFVEVVSPPSIKRYEYLHLDVILYNYLNHSLPVRVTLGFSDGLIMPEGTEKRSQVHCISARESKTVLFTLQGLIFGKSSINVMAEIESSYPEECGPEVIINRRDMVAKEVVIEAEGHPVTITKSVILCTNDTTQINNISWPLELPTDMIENSAKAKLVINGDLLGPTIHNLEKLLVVPTGCGEQIMATLAPNLFILQYLKATGSLTPSLQQRARRNLKIGYQRILDYVHNDGSFSAFGYHDQSGSTFLTAFVVKVLQQSKEYVYIDQNVINNAVRWIINNQLENGCFATISHVFHDMGGTLTENSTAALTSYVIISLLESGIELSEKVKTNAKYCIRGHFSPDKYTLAISTYALSLIGWESEAKRCLSKLLQVATQQDNLVWWSSSGAASTNIEMTAYVLMSLVYQNSTENLIYANAAVRWLTSQRGGHGGFISTQDTVVALDAITKYALLVHSSTTDLHVTVALGQEENEIIIKSKDRLKTKEQIVKKLPNKVDVTIEGKGCVLIQSNLDYNLESVANSEAFKLAVDVDSVSSSDQCSMAVVSACVSYVGNAIHSNMAILEITLPSGYEPDRASLFRLVEENQSKVKKFEESINRVVLYFTEIDNEPICVPFTIVEHSRIGSRMDANVKLYDYYNPDIQVTMRYNVSTCIPKEVVAIPTLSDSRIMIDETKEDSSELIENIIEVNTQKSEESDLGLNPDFVDVDIDLAVPDGWEANAPVYVKPPNENIND
ncbi:pregnancy zone protein-like isoform X2 [Photinus pyralis]|nr:pregnancy zone protein-like isoform X2 [Photinus pyralis]